MDRAEFLEETRLEARDALALIVAARDLDPEALIPTPLMVAIEAARRVL